MMQRTSAIRMAGLLAVFFVFDLSGCSQRSRLPPPRDQDLVIKLRWIKSYPNQSRSDVSTGLFWALSFLGAKLPADAAIKELVASATRVVASYRKTLASKVDFTGLQDHSNAEALYLSFAEPTASRLASEWNIPLDRVRQLLAGRSLKTHPHSEAIDDDILGDDLYNRNDVDSLAPYAAIRGPSDMREASDYEPDLLK